MLFIKFVIKKNNNKTERLKLTMEIKTIKKLTGITLVTLTALAMGVKTLTPQTIEEQPAQAETVKVLDQNKKEEKLPESKAELVNEAVKDVKEALAPSTVFKEEIAAEPAKEKVEPQTLKIKGNTIKWYTEIGQAGINADHNVATTWGGDFSPGRSTLIAGHDDGPMFQATKLEAGDVVSVFDKEGKEFQYRFLKKKIIPMVYDGQGSGFVEHEEDDQYLADVLDTGNFLNLQVCVEYNASGYKIMIATLEPMN